MEQKEVRQREIENKKYLTSQNKSQNKNINNKSSYNDKKIHQTYICCDRIEQFVQFY